MLCGVFFFFGGSKKERKKDISEEISLFKRSSIEHPTTSTSTSMACRMKMSMAKTPTVAVAQQKKKNKKKAVVMKKKHSHKVRTTNTQKPVARRVARAAHHPPTCCEYHSQGWLQALNTAIFKEGFSTCEYSSDDSPVFKAVYGDAPIAMRGHSIWNPKYDSNYGTMSGGMHPNTPSAGIAIALQTPSAVFAQPYASRMFFHGTASDGVNGIVSDSGALLPGPRQAFANDLAADGQPVGKGVYASDDVKVAIDYARRIPVATCTGEVGYKAVLICRAERPRAPVQRPDYWVCDKLHAYKILILDD